VVEARRHPRRGAGGVGSGGTEESRLGSAGAVEKMKLTSGPHVSAGGQREGAEYGRRESKKEAYFCKYANGAHGRRAAWAGKLASACGRRGASGAGWAESRVGR
jgi:hypothetical protein